MAGYWIAYIVVMIIATVLAVVLRPKPLIPNLLPGTVSNAPTAEYGAVIPVLFGRAYLKQPNITYWGAVHAEPIIEKLSQGKS